MNTFMIFLAVFCLMLISDAHRITRLPLTRRLPTILNGSFTTGHGGVVPVHGDFGKIGEYYIDIRIGGQQPTTVIIDTGSSDFAVSATGCHGCTHESAGGWYDPSKSTNATALGCAWCDSHVKICNQGCDSTCKLRKGHQTKQCTFRTLYEDNTGFSAAGWLDQVQLGDLPPTSSGVGAIYESKMNDPKPIVGIIGTTFDPLLTSTPTHCNPDPTGLADPSESDYGATTPIDDLVTIGAIDNMFGNNLDSAPLLW
jgi:hypothetical protein